MKVLDIGLERPSIHPTTIVTMMVFMMAEVFKCMRVMEDMALGLRILAILPRASVEFIVVVIKSGDDGRGGYRYQ